MTVAPTSAKRNAAFSLVLRGVDADEQVPLSELLTVSGILDHGHHKTAVLAGQWVSEGEIMYIRFNGRLQALKVVEIRKKEVVLEVVDEPDPS